MHGGPLDTWRPPARARREVRREGYASEVLSLGSSGQLPLETPRKFWIFREVTCDGLAGQGLDLVVTEMHRIHAN